jgi:hypothetical protein
LEAVPPAANWHPGIAQRRIAELDGSSNCTITVPSVTGLPPLPESVTTHVATFC